MLKKNRKNLYIYATLGAVLSVIGIVVKNPNGMDAISSSFIIPGLSLFIWSLWMLFIKQRA